MSGKAAEIIRIARTQIGYREGYSGGHWNNRQKYSPAVPGLEWSQNQAWCATFVSWCARQAGVTPLYPVTASVWTAMNWFKARGRYSDYPAIGAQVIFGRSGSTHTGLVVAYDGEFITTVEGNTNDSGSAEGNGVYLKRRQRRDSYVHGYGLPDFPEGVTTADPALKGQRGYTYKAVASGPTGGAHSKPGKTRIVVVKAGQSLGAIAASAGVSLAALLALNPQLKDPDVVHPGDRITVPAKPKPDKPKTPEYPGASRFKTGAVNPYVTRLGEALVRKGYGRYYSLGPGPRWSESDRRAVAAFQRAQGWSGAEADGYPGPETWRRLMG